MPRIKDVKITEKATDSEYGFKNVGEFNGWFVVNLSPLKIDLNHTGNSSSNHTCSGASS